MLFQAPIDNLVLYAKYINRGLLAEKDYLDATVGLDKNDFLIPRPYLNLQYSFNYVLDYEEGLKTRYATGIKYNFTRRTGY